VQDRVVQDRAIEDRAVQDRAVQDRAIENRAVHDRGIQDRAVQDRAVHDRTIRDRAAQNRAVQDFTTFLAVYSHLNSLCLKIPSGPGSVVGIATGYGLDSPGIEYRWGREFPHLSRPAPGTIQPPVQWVPGLSWG
jgi:hypothetical protein